MLAECQLSARQAQRLARVGQDVVLAVDHNPSQLRVAVAPPAEPVLDPDQVSPELVRLCRTVGARDDQAQDRGHLLVDRNPAGDLWEHGGGQVFARKLTPVAPRLSTQPGLHKSNLHPFT